MAGPSGGPEVPLDEPQQPFSFGDFTKPSDFHGTIFWPQQWGDAGASNQVISIKTLNANSNLFDFLFHPG